MVGKLVKFKIPSLHGPMSLAGTVGRILPDGRMEVRSQQHGYWKLEPAEIFYGWPFPDEPQDERTPRQARDGTDI